MGHRNDLALGIRKAAQFAAGFGFAGAGAGGVATAGTAAQISPTLGERVRGGFSAISPGFRAFEESRAEIGRTSAETNLALEEARQLRLEEERKRKPVNLRNLTGGFITERTQKKLEEALDANADGFTTQDELEKGLPKLDKQIIVDAISEDITEFTKNKKQNEANVTALIEQANKKMLGTGTTITKQDFQTNPELGRTFPKIAEAITRQDSVQDKIDVLANKRVAIQGVLKREAEKKPPTFSTRKLAEIDEIMRREGVDFPEATRRFTQRTAPRGALTRAQVLTGTPLNDALRRAKARIDKGEDENQVISQVILSDNRFTLVSADIIRILRKSKTTDDFFTQITNMITAIQGGGGVSVTVPTQPVTEGVNVLTEGERAEKKRLKGIRGTR
ncbi:MAG: hypothetical protein V3U58_07920 [Thermodesulfobacteriota bacterium]